MKRNISFPVLWMMLFISFFSNCKTDSNYDPDPSDARSRFVGQWSVTEVKKKLSYEVSITQDTQTSDGVLIYNFGGFGSSVAARAIVSGSKITLIANQEIVPGVTIDGSGTLSENTKIHWSYNIDDGATLISVTAIYTKI